MQHGLLFKTINGGSVPRFRQSPVVEGQGQQR